MPTNLSTIIMICVVGLGVLLVLREAWCRWKLKRIEDEAFVMHSTIRYAGVPAADVIRLRRKVESSLGVEGKLHPDMTIDQLASLTLLGDWIDEIIRASERGDNMVDLEKVDTLADLIVEMWKVDATDGSSRQG